MCCAVGVALVGYWGLLMRWPCRHASARIRVARGQLGRIGARAGVVADRGPCQWCDGCDVLPAVQSAARVGVAGWHGGKGAMSGEGGGRAGRRRKRLGRARWGRGAWVHVSTVCVGVPWNGGM